MVLQNLAKISQVLQIDFLKDSQVRKSGFSMGSLLMALFESCFWVWLLGFARPWAPCLTLQPLPCPGPLALPCSSAYAALLPVSQFFCPLLGVERVKKKSILSSFWKSDSWYTFYLIFHIIPTHIFCTIPDPIFFVPFLTLNGIEMHAKSIMSSLLICIPRLRTSWGARWCVLRFSLCNSRRSENRWAVKTCHKNGLNITSYTNNAR